VDIPSDYQSSEYEPYTRAFLNVDTPLAFYHNELKNPIVFTPVSDVGNSIQQNLPNLLVREVAKQNPTLAQKITEIRRGDFYRQIVGLYSGKKYTSYGFSLKKEYTSLSVNPFLSKETRWGHVFLNYQIISPIVIPAGTLQFYTQLRAYFIEHLETIDFSDDQLINTSYIAPGPGKRYTTVSSRKDKIKTDLERLKSLNRDETLGGGVSKMLNPQHENVNTAYGFQLLSCI